MASSASAMVRFLFMNKLLPYQPRRPDFRFTARRSCSLFIFDRPGMFMSLASS